MMEMTHLVAARTAAGLPIVELGRAVVWAVDGAADASASVRAGAGAEHGKGSGGVRAVERKGGRHCVVCCCCRREREGRRSEVGEEREADAWALQERQTEETTAVDGVVHKERNFRSMVLTNFCRLQWLRGKVNFS
jgi:hypothetical protein